MYLTITLLFQLRLYCTVDEADKPSKWHHITTTTNGVHLNSPRSDDLELLIDKNDLFIYLSVRIVILRLFTPFYLEI